MMTTLVRYALCLALLLSVGCGGDSDEADPETTDERGEPYIERLDPEAQALAYERAAELQRQTILLTAMMRGMLGAHEQFKAARQEGSLNHDGGYPIGWDHIPNQSLSSSERFVFGMRMLDEANTLMLAALHADGPDTFERTFVDKDGDGTEELYDPWGNELEYRSFNDGLGRGPQTHIDNRLLPLSASPYFISAGPDGVFGPDARGNIDDISTLDDPVYRVD